jgi:hypothetical protein
MPLSKCPGRANWGARAASQECRNNSPSRCGASQPFREAFVLREINDLSYSETTDVVGAPLGTVVFPPKGTFCRHIGR